MPNGTERRMPLTKDAAQAVVVDLNKAYAQIDDVLAHTLRASANMIDVGRSMGLDPLSGQQIYADLGRCANAILEGRESLVAAHKKAHRFRKLSEMADEDMFGCPRGAKVDRVKKPTAPTGVQLSAVA